MPIEPQRASQNGRHTRFILVLDIHELEWTALERQLDTADQRTALGIIFHDSK